MSATAEAVRGSAASPLNPQLAYGEATDLNMAAQQARSIAERNAQNHQQIQQQVQLAATTAQSRMGSPTVPGQIETPATPSEQPAAAPGAPEEQFTPTTPQDRYLFGPTQRPDEPVAPLDYGPPPPEMDDWLPYLANAAALPDADPAVRQLFHFAMSRVIESGPV